MELYLWSCIFRGKRLPYEYLFTLSIALLAFTAGAQTTTSPKPAVIGAIAKPSDIPKIKSEEAGQHIGETITVTGIVKDGRFLESAS